MINLSSYKGHSIFALIIAILFFKNPLLIALSLIGGNIPDFDHEFKKESVFKILILGLILFITLYILKQPLNISLLVIFLGLVFYFSQHRSFTHSIFGVLTLTATVSLLIISGVNLIGQIPELNNPYLMIAILIAILSFLFLNKKVLMIFLPAFFISIFILPVKGLNYFNIVFALFLGLFSHVVLDSFTPSGIKLFAPLSSKKVYKKFGIAMTILLVLLSLIMHFPLILSILNN